MTNSNPQRAWILAASLSALGILGLSQPAIAVGPSPAKAPLIEAESTTPPPAAAAKPQEPPPPPALPAGGRSATKLELDSIRTQNALAAERAKASGAMPGAGSIVPAMDARPITVTSSAGRGGSGSSSMQVTMVAGPLEKMVATIMTPRGLMVAKVGDRVPDAGVVRSISVNQVLVDDGKRTYSLPFAAEPASSLIQGATPMVMNPTVPAIRLQGGQ